MAGQKPDQNTKLIKMGCSPKTCNKCIELYPKFERGRCEKCSLSPVKNKKDTLEFYNELLSG